MSESSDGGSDIDVSCKSVDMRGVPGTNKSINDTQGRFVVSSLASTPGKGELIDHFSF